MVPGASVVKNLRTCLPMQEMQEMRIWYVGLEDPLKMEMATHSSILVWRIPWTEEPGGLQSMGSQRVRHSWAGTHTHTHTSLYITLIEGSALVWDVLESESCSVVSKSLLPHGLYRPQNSPGQNTGVGSLSLLQGDLPNPGIEPRSPALQLSSADILTGMDLTSFSELVCRIPGAFCFLLKALSKDITG